MGWHRYYNGWRLLAQIAGGSPAALDSQAGESYSLRVNPLPIHLHRHVYWVVPLLVIGVLLLVYWALTSGGGESRGPQL